MAFTGRGVVMPKQGVERPAVTRCRDINVNDVTPDLGDHTVSQIGHLKADVRQSVGKRAIGC